MCIRDRHVGCAVGARVERLVAVDVHLAVALRGRGGHGGAVRARLRLGEAEREGLFALQRVSQDLLLLLLVAEREDVVNLGGEVDPAQRRVAQRVRFLGHHDLGERVGGRAAELLGDAEGGKAGLHEGVHGLLGVFVVAVALLEVVLEVAPLHDGFQAVEQKLLLLGLLEVHGLLLSFEGIGGLPAGKGSRCEAAPPAGNRMGRA